jgi:phosphoglycolate phosphatase
MVDVNVSTSIIKGVELFVFDKDGTLMDLYTYWSNMIKMRAEKICVYYKLDGGMHKDNLMNVMGIDTVNKRLKPEGPVGILPREIVQKAAEDYIAKYGFNNVKEVCFNIFKEVDAESLLSLNEFIKPIKGAAELIEGLKKRECKIAIATTDKTERAELAIKFLGIAGLVDIIVGADRVKNSKPEPDMLIAIGQMLGVSPYSSIMVGDAETDVLMGMNAGFKASIGVCGGITARERLSSVTPYVIDDISKVEITL